MKQQPTIEEWKELDINQRADFWRALGVEVASPSLHMNLNRVLTDSSWIKYRKVAERIPNIGEMIWFIGDDLTKILNLEDIWYIYPKQGKKLYYVSEELVDTLYQIVKEKLNKRL